VAPGGQGQVTIHLNPGELGTVEVKIARAPDGTATVTVQVEKAETLQTMQLDIAHLHQALDRAGVPAEQREVTMHLVPAAATSSFSADAGTSGGSNNGGFGAGTAGGQGQRGGQQQQQGHGSNGALLTPHTPEHADTPRWQAAGINITA
jgi:flagellar hook-length control protein FliK